MQLSIEDSMIALVALQAGVEAALYTLEDDLKMILLTDSIESVDRKSVIESLNNIPMCLGVCHKLLLNSGDLASTEGLKEKDAFLREEFHNHAKIASEIGLRPDGLDEQVFNAG